MSELEDILKWMLEMQAKTNDTLTKLSEKIDSLWESTQLKVSEWVEPDAIEEAPTIAKKIIERKMYKLLTYKVLPIRPEDAYNDWGFKDWGIEYKDMNKRFDSEQEAKAYCEEHEIKDYKLLPITVPVPEWEEYKVRRPNIYI